MGLPARRKGGNSALGVQFSELGWREDTDGVGQKGKAIEDLVIFLRGYGQYGGMWWKKAGS